MTGTGLLSQEVLGMTATGQNSGENSPSITLEATVLDERRAEAIKYANQEWCPIENRLYGQKSSSTPSLLPVFTNKMITSQKHKKSIITSLEYFWGMQKLTLDLDVPRNRFFLGPSLEKLYYGCKWTLLPQLSVVKQCFDREEDPYSRDSAPALDDPTYEYTFRVIDPTEEMKNLTIRRLNHAGTSVVDSDSSIHTYPFDTLSKTRLVSHINPRFAIMHAGYCVVLQNAKRRLSLYNQYPTLELCFTLWLLWQKPLIKRHVRDPAFNPGQDSDDGDYERDEERFVRIWETGPDTLEGMELESDHESEVDIDELLAMNPEEVLAMDMLAVP